MATCEENSLRQRWQEYQELERLREHWYWRPGWRVGRSFYTWHLTFDAANAVHHLVRTVQQDLNLPIVDPVPAEGLHLTMQGVGFTDEVSSVDFAAMVASARGRCREIPPFELTLGPVDADAEGVGLLVDPWAPVERVRHALRESIKSVWGEVPEPQDGFRPHVTVAYSATDAPVADLRARLAVLRRLPPVVTTVRAAQLIALNRDHRVYRWTVEATAPFAGPP